MVPVPFEQRFPKAAGHIDDGMAEPRMIPQRRKFGARSFLREAEGIINVVLLLLLQSDNYTRTYQSTVSLDWYTVWPPEARVTDFGRTNRRVH